MSNFYFLFSRQASRNSSRKQKHFLFEVGGNIGKSTMTKYSSEVGIDVLCGL